MRLLKCRTDSDGPRFSLTMCEHNNAPPYAILSHTWAAKESDEFLYEDIVCGRGEHKPGYHKLELCEKLAREDGLEYFWVDTCCIDKTSSSELSEAINSMFQWYQGAEVCYAYLSDVWKEESDSFPYDTLRNSKWFTRSWTLQELIAPKCIRIISANGHDLGERAELLDIICAVTQIPTEAFKCPLDKFSIQDRLAWAHNRVSKREEDAAYSLLGIMGVHIPLVYGEGRNKAFIRLIREAQQWETIGDPVQYLKSFCDEPSGNTAYAKFPVPEEKRGVAAYQRDTIADFREGAHFRRPDSKEQVASAQSHAKARTEGNHRSCRSGTFESIHHRGSHFHNLGGTQNNNTGSGMIFINAK